MSYRVIRKPPRPPHLLGWILVAVALLVAAGFLFWPFQIRAQTATIGCGMPATYVGHGILPASLRGCLPEAHRRVVSAAIVGGSGLALGLVTGLVTFVHAVGTSVLDMRAMRRRLE